MGIITDYTVYTCPPPRCSEVEMSVYAVLDELGIVYSRVSHAPAASISDCGEIDALLGTPMCKNLLLCPQTPSGFKITGGDFFLVILPGDMKFRAALLKDRLGVPRMTFAPGEDMERLLGVPPGALTVMALKNDTGRRVRLIVERRLARSEFIACHPCVNTSSIKIRTSDLFDVFLPYINHEAEIVDLG